MSRISIRSNQSNQNADVIRGVTQFPSCSACVLRQRFVCILHGCSLPDSCGLSAYWLWNILYPCPISVMYIYATLLMRYLLKHSVSVNWTTWLLWFVAKHETTTHLHHVHVYFGCGLSQWETKFQRNFVSHWMSKYPEWSPLFLNILGPR